MLVNAVLVLCQAHKVNSFKEVPTDQILFAGIDEKVSVLFYLYIQPEYLGVSP